MGRQVSRRLSTRRPPPAETASSCNCVSCYALAPLCGAVPPPRPQRSLSQQQLRRHQRLSGSLVEPVELVERPAGVTKWCSESDVSVLELEPAATERYDDCYEYDDFDMDFDLDDDLGLTNNIPRRRRGTETVDLYVDRAQLRQLQTPAVLRHKSQSTESFFEQPNEEGSLYMYGGRKRIAVKAPSAANIYDRVRGSTDSDRGHGHRRRPSGRLNLGARMQQHQQQPQLPAPSWRGGGKRQEQAQNADKRQRYDNATSNNSNSNNISGSNNNSKQHKRQLTNATKDNDDMLKSKNYFNSKTKSIATATAAAAAKATAVGAASAAGGGGGGKSRGGGGGNPTMSPTLATTNSTSVASPAAANNAPVSGGLSAPPPPPAPTAASTRPGRSASRLDISDMESIYGYLKPRKPRSLSLKKIQILDY